MIFELLLDVMDRACETPTLNAPITPYLQDGSFGVALSQALRARLRSHRPLSVANVLKETMHGRG
jgi:hypothetical protein